MGGWHPFSGTSYAKFLENETLVRDLNGNITVIGQAIKEEISSLSRNINESSKHTANQINNNLNSINNVLLSGFNNLNKSIENVEWAIDNLNADFNYNMGLLLSQMEVSNWLFVDIIDKLDVIHQTLKNPLLNQARELYRIGVHNLKRNLLEESLKSFLMAAEKNTSDFFTHYQIGNLYLSGITEYENIIDLKKANKHFLLANRYAKAEINFDNNFKKLYAVSLFKTSLSIYFQLNKEELQRNSSNGQEMLNNAKIFANLAYENSSELIEAKYHIAKFEALQKNTNNVLYHLKKCFLTDWRYIVKIIDEDVFNEIREKILLFITKDLFRELLSKSSNTSDTIEINYNLARLESLLKNIKKSLSYLEICIRKDWRFIKRIKEDRIFDNMRYDILVLLNSLPVSITKDFLN